MIGGDEIRIAGRLLDGVLVTWSPRRLPEDRDRTAFFDHPVGYKEHSRRPLPRRRRGDGGVSAATIVFGVADDFTRLLAAALVLFVLGTLDDRIGLGVTPRLIAQVATGGGPLGGGPGLDDAPSEAANLLLTILWVVGITNAFNLMDNLDGATGTVAGVCTAGAGALALIQGMRASR